MYGTFADNMAEPEPTSVKETVEDTVEIIDYDSDELNEQFEDASDRQSEFKSLRVCARDLIRLPVCQV